MLAKYWDMANLEKLSNCYTWSALHRVIAAHVNHQRADAAAAVRNNKNNNHRRRRMTVACIPMTTTTTMTMKPKLRNI